MGDIDARDQQRAQAPAIARFDNVSIWFHWTTLLLIVVMFATAFARERAGDGDSAAFLLTLHRSTGVATWLVTLVRLDLEGARWAPAAASVRHTPECSDGPRGMTEYGLFLLLIVQPITGFVQSIARGKPFALLGLSFPAVIARDRDLTHLFASIHSTGALCCWR